MLQSVHCANVELPHSLHLYLSHPVLGQIHDKVFVFCVVYLFRGGSARFVQSSTRPRRAGEVLHRQGAAAGSEL